MDGSSFKKPLKLLLLLSGLCAPLGCQQGSFGGPGATGGTAATTTPAANPNNAQQVAQIQQQQQRLSGLDQRNQELVAQLADQKRKYTLQEEQINLYKKQLADTVTQLKQQTAAVKQAEERWTQFASQRKTGAITIRKSNNSLVNKLQVPKLDGYEVKTEDDTVRIIIPAQRLFYQGATQLTSPANASLSQIGRTLAQQYPRNRIGVEGHADASVGANQHAVSVAWATAVFTHLTQTGLKQHQMFIMGHGGNFPRYSAGTTAGAAANQRIEIVIYPESIDQ